MIALGHIDEPGRLNDKLRSRGLPAYQADPDAGRCVERYDACEPGPLSQFETEFERCADWRFHHWPLFVLTCDCQSTGIGLHLVRWGTALAWCPTDRLVVYLVWRSVGSGQQSQSV
jgi:hypothetical protein